MNDQPMNLTGSDTLAQKNNLPDVEFFDPPMCCPTGMCGPTIDQTLLDVSETIAKLQSKGFQVERYQMTTHPDAFTGNAEVMKLIREKQLAALPIIAVRGGIIAAGNYPSLNDVIQASEQAREKAIGLVREVNQEISRLIGIDFATLTRRPGGCC